jgi:hypothetical protein
MVPATTSGDRAAVRATYTDAERRYASWFHALDAWTEYWDIYHPETRGRFYFGDGQGEPGLLTQFLPRGGRPAAFKAWSAAALWGADRERWAAFAREIRVSDVAAAVVEVDDLVGRLFEEYFGSAGSERVRLDYLDAVRRFAANVLPPALERASRIADDDPRKRTAGHHTLDGDLMWFGWALHLEAAHELRGLDQGHARRTLMMAGIATGCPADFACRGHRRTRPEYRNDDTTTMLLRERGARWALDFAAAAQEVHTLYRIREWGTA